jgi:hypothetical protein
LISFPHGTINRDSDIFETMIVVILLLALQSLLKVEFTKTITTFGVLQIIFVLFGANVISAIISTIVFGIFSYLIYYFEDSIFKWMFILIAAGITFEFL